MEQVNKISVQQRNHRRLSRHTAYLNLSSTIVPHLREQLNVELGTQAWGKIYEILVQFNLIPYPPDQGKWISLHLCEAPGAFISGLNHYLTTQSTSLLRLRLYIFV